MNLIEQIKTWLGKHKSIEKTLKTALVAGGIAFFTIITGSYETIVASYPEYATMLVVLLALCNGALNYLKHMKN